MRTRAKIAYMLLGNVGAHHALVTFLAISCVFLSLDYSDLKERLLVVC